MYLDFYHLREKPFQINTDPKFLWLGEKHKEAQATLKYGILDNKGFLLLTGGVGTGKTTLINSLVDEIREEICVATVPDPNLEELDFYNFISNAFGIEQAFTSKGAFLSEFAKFLHAAHDDGKKVLLIIDECQKLNYDQLERIRLLSNIEKPEAKLINIFFIGQSEFNDMLLEERNLPIRQRITINYNIKPLTLEETGEYIRHRVRVAGSSNDIFDSDAIREIFFFSNGNPRQINIICDHALLTAFVKEKHKIIKEDIVECSEELKILPYSVKEEKISQTPSEQPAPVLGKPLKKRYSPLFFIVFFVLAVSAYLLLALVFNRSPLFFLEYLQPVQTNVDVKPKRPDKDEKPPSTIPLQDESRFKSEESVVADEKQDMTSVLEQKLSEAPAIVTETEKTDLSDGILSMDEPIQLKLPEKIIVRFPPRSSRLSEESRKKIDEFLVIAETIKNAEIMITGYTDSTGSDAVNKKVSKERADFVRLYIIDQGFPYTQVFSFGKGSENPIASNDTQEGRSANRRVEIELTVPEEETLTE